MSRLKLGIPMIGGKHWMGGIAYTELLLKALQTVAPPERPECCLIVESATWPEWPLYERLRLFFSCAVVRTFPDMSESERQQLEQQLALPLVYAEDEPRQQQQASGADRHARLGPWRIKGEGGGGHGGVSICLPFMSQAL